MEEFQKQIANGFIIERVNLSQATVAEALKFKKHLEMDIELGYKTIVVDLSNCNSMDPAFIGVLVVTLKQLMRLGGSIKIVKPGMFSKSMLNLTGTIEKFELYESLDNAMASMIIKEQRIAEFSNQGLDRLALA